MARGGRPVPTALKVLRGNPGRRPLNEREPVPGPLAVAVPRELEGREARREWRRTIAPAIGIGLITEADRVSALAHCELWATWRAQLAIAAKGPEVLAVGAAAYPTPNVARGMANRTLQALIKVDAELGLTPASRSKVQVGGGRPAGVAANPLARFLKKAP